MELNKNYIDFEENEITKIPYVIKKALSGEHKILSYAGTLKDYDFVKVSKETKTHYIGIWAEGLGFIDVQFPKKFTKNVSLKELVQLSKTWSSMNGTPVYKNNYFSNVFKYYLFRILFFIPYKIKKSMFGL